MSYSKMAGFGVIAAAFLWLSGTVLWYRGDVIAAKSERDLARIERDSLQADLKEAVDVNADNQKTISELQEQARFDGRVVAEFMDEMRQNRAAVEALAEDQAKLKEENATVRDWLLSAVPDDYRRMRKR